MNGNRKRTCTFNEEAAFVERAADLVRVVLAAEVALNLPVVEISTDELVAADTTRGLGSNQRHVLQRRGKKLTLKVSCPL